VSVVAPDARSGAARTRRTLDARPRPWDTASCNTAGSPRAIHPSGRRPVAGRPVAG
jgi:hypothetical protein